MAIINNERYAKYYHKLGAVYERPEIKASLEVIFSVFMVVLLIFAAIRPTLTNLTALQKRISDKESLNTKADKKISQLFSAHEQLDQFSSFLNLYENAVPQQFNYTEMIGRVEQLARSNNLEVEVVSVPGISLIGDSKGVGEWSTKLLKPDGEKIITTPVDFQVSGKPKQIRDFLVQLESMDRLTTIKSVNLIKETGSSKGTERIKAGGQVNFYSLINTK